MYLYVSLLLFCSIPISGFAKYKDETTFIQQMINNAKPFDTINGNGKTYYVTSLYLKSKITIENFNFIAIPSTQDFNAVLNIIGGRSVKSDMQHLIENPSDITLYNININGNRSEQMNIVTPTEDGGRHGIRIIGKANNIKILNCNIYDCATDGICIFSASSSRGSQINLPFKNILIKNTSVEYNRRHGMSGDGIDGIAIQNCNFSHNGVSDGTQLTTQNKLSGKVGASVNQKGQLQNYGNGIDFEGYGLGSRITNVVISNSKFLGNGRHGLLFLDSNYGKGFLQRDKITIVDCQFDYGVAQNGNEKAALSFVGRSGDVYTNVTLKRNTFSGYVVIKYSSDFNFIDNQFNPPLGATKAVILVNAEKINFNKPAMKPKIYTHLSNFTLGGK